MPSAACIAGEGKQERGMKKFADEMILKEISRLINFGKQNCEDQESRNLDCKALPVCSVQNAFLPLCSREPHYLGVGK